MDGITFAKYLLAMAGVTYAIRAVPLLLFRRPIRSCFARSVLHYAPYAVLGAMTFPDILYATASPLPSGVGLVVAFIAAWRNLPMVVVALLGSAAAVAVQVIFL